MVQIINRFTGALIREIETFNKANLRGAELFGADLRGANLFDADLSGAQLRDADLRGANLRGTDLRKANLRGADLSAINLFDARLTGADFSGANLSLAEGVAYAQISFAGHGEIGRQLLAVKIDGQIMFFCGCFQGTEADLREYIENGQEELKSSRTFALETCLKAISFQPNFVM